MQDENVGLLDIFPTGGDYDYNYGLVPESGPGGAHTQVTWEALEGNCGSNVTGVGSARGHNKTGLLDELTMRDMSVPGGAYATSFEMTGKILSKESDIPTMNSSPDQQPQTVSIPTSFTTLASLLSTTTEPTSTTSTSSSLFSTPTTFHPSPVSSATSSSAHANHKASPDDESVIALKRQRNTSAARRYRQKRLDRIADLERALEAMTSERDDLRLKLARREAEANALREMLNK